MPATIALVVIAAGIVQADEVKTWRDGKGNTHVTITGDPADAPEPEPVPAPSEADDRFSIETSLRRRDIERKLGETSLELERTRAETARAEKSNYPLEPAPTPLDREERERWSDLRRNALLGANAFEEEKRRRLFTLHRDERAILREIRDLWGALDRLRSEVRSYYGKLPSWWIDRVRCAGCPTFEEIDRELAKNEVDIAGKTAPTPTPTAGPSPPTPHSE